MTLSVQEIKRVEMLMTLFRGSTKAHGVYMETQAADPLKKKVQGKCMTVSMAPTLKKWTAHITGEAGIGIVPINEDNMCYWGALDIDGEVDHVHLLERIDELNLPFNVCLSKSRSAHCYLHLEQPVPAESMRSMLEEMASKLGYAGCEIFPKQSVLNIDKGDLGNWLNMPYYKGNTRKGIRLVNGELEEMDLPTFLEYAYSRRLSDSQWSSLIGSVQKTLEDLESVLQGAPPCIQYILKTQGIQEGNRNKLMYNIAVYCKKKYPEEIFADKVKEIHDEYAESPLSIKELNNVIDSVTGKDYRYQCKDGMLKQFCNSSICVERENGIDFSTEIKSIKSATRILVQPNVYAVEVELQTERPTQVYVTVDELFKQDTFRKACSEQIHKTFVPMATKTWNQITTDIVNKAINQDPPYDMMESAQIYFALTEFCANRGQESPDVLANEEGVFFSRAQGKAHFRMAGLRSFLIRKAILSKDVSIWTLGKKLNEIEIPTEDIDYKAGTSIKRKVPILPDTIHINGKSVYTRSISLDELQASDVLREAMGGVE